MKADADGLRGSIEVATLVGVSYRQLNHWATRGWVTPSHLQTRGTGGAVLLTPYPEDRETGVTGYAALYDAEATEHARRFAILVRLGITPVSADLILTRRERVEVVWRALAVLRSVYPDEVAP